MVEQTILQHWIFTRFALPFLLIFFIVFGILEKTKLFGADKKQLNALIAFVIGLIVIGAASPTLMISNLILFLTVGIVVLFVALLLWGFVTGEEGLKFEKMPKMLKLLIGVVIIVAVIIALLWVLGVEGTIFGTIFSFLFKNDWSSGFWTNAAFVVVIIIALVLILKKSGDSK
ncbi:MAG TPA: hypothetical protein VMV95_04040 [Bacillota bacterium]|nr:hypothetical protein [Bacillota bacterium]